MESSSTKRMVVGKRRREGIAQFMSLKPIHFFEDVLSVVNNLIFRSNRYQCFLKFLVKFAKEFLEKAYIKQYTSTFFHHKGRFYP